MGLDGLRVVVYPNDHRPAHVHVIGRGCEAVFNLNCPAGPVELRENYRSFASGVESYTKRLEGALRRVVPGMGAYSWHCVINSNRPTSVRRIWRHGFRGGLRALRSQDWADWGSSQYNLIVSFSPDDVEGLEGARPDELKKIEISPSGFGIHFPALDADLYVPGLLEGFLGSRAWMAAKLGQMGGRSRSKGKRAASRVNGKLGAGRGRLSNGSVVCFRLQAIVGKADGSMFCAGPMFAIFAGVSPRRRLWINLSAMPTISSCGFRGRRFTGSIRYEGCQKLNLPDPGALRTGASRKP